MLRSVCGEEILLQIYHGMAPRAFTARARRAPTPARRPRSTCCDPRAPRERAPRLAGRGTRAATLPDAAARGTSRSFLRNLCACVRNCSLDLEPTKQRTMLYLQPLIATYFPGRGSRSYARLRMYRLGRHLLPARGPAGARDRGQGLLRAFGVGSVPRHRRRRARVHRHLRRRRRASSELVVSLT